MMRLEPLTALVKTHGWTQDHLQDQGENDYLEVENRGLIPVTP